MTIHPLKLVAIGFLLVLCGFLVPLLMVVQILEANYVVGFLSYGASIAGLFLGLIGTAQYNRFSKR